MLGVTGVTANEEVTHYISAVGSVWELSNSTFVISSNQAVYSSSLVTTGNADFDNPDWPGFNFVWLNGDPYWGLGLYKVTNSKQTDKYFYLDARDSEFGMAAYTPDFHICFFSDSSVYKYEDENYHWVPIDNGSLVTVWGIHGVSGVTDGLQNYWQNALAYVNDGNNHPHLIWGPYPNQGFSVTTYKIYRKIGSSSFQVCGTSSTPEYDDVDVNIVTGALRSNETVADYKVTAVSDELQESGYSNTVEVNRVQGDPPEKRRSPDLTFDYSLDQNYPNPFNPLTKISFKVASPSFVSLKIFDIEGKEVATIVSETLPEGEYTKIWNANGFQSGVYFYRLLAGSFSVTKKLILLK